jgi:hypothetical protein
MRRVAEAGRRERDGGTRSVANPNSGDRKFRDGRGSIPRSVSLAERHEINRVSR